VNDALPQATVSVFVSILPLAVIETLPY